MKKLWNILVLTLAVNFVALGGGVFYLYRTQRLDKDKVHAIREMLFPTEVAATQPTTEPATQPVFGLDELLASHANLPALEQIQLLQRTFDSRMAQVDQQRRDVETLHDLVKNAEAKLSADRAAFEKERLAFETHEKEATQLAADKGFQDSLQLYGTMKPKQVKQVFAELADDVIVRYLRAMEPEQATKILKEFKTPAEAQRVKKWMEQVREAEPSASANQ